MVILVMILGINSCSSSSRKSALEDYNNSVATLARQSVQNDSTALFSEIKSVHGSGSTPSAVPLVKTAYNAQHLLTRAKAMSVPDQMRTAQNYFVLALQMRSDALGDISQKIVPALGTSGAKDALASITADMSTLYSSDVVYKSYAARAIAQELNGNGLSVGGSSNLQIYDGQFVPDLGWLDQATIAQRIGSTASGSASGTGGSTTCTSQACGHTLNSVSVAGSTLESGTTNAVAASPAPTFTLNFTNSGDSTETGVICEVKVGGTSIVGKVTVAQTTPQQTLTCSVKLPSSPSPGQYTVTATIEKVPGEKTLSNNTLSFPVTFT